MSRLWLFPGSMWSTSVPLSGQRVPSRMSSVQRLPSRSLMSWVIAVQLCGSCVLRCEFSHLPDMFACFVVRNIFGLDC